MWYLSSCGPSLNQPYAASFLCMTNRSKFGAQSMKLALLILIWKQIYAVSNIILDLAITLRYVPFIYIFEDKTYGAKSFCIGFLLIFTTNQCGAELELWSALLTMCTALHTPPQKKKKKRDIDQCNSAILWFDPHVKLCACSCINKICYLTIFGWIWCFGDKPIV